MSFGIQSRRVRTGLVHASLPQCRPGVGTGTTQSDCRVARRSGLYGLRSHEKFVPRDVFGLSQRQVALFLHHLWATDGSLGVFKRGDGRPGEDLLRIDESSAHRRCSTSARTVWDSHASRNDRKGDHRPGYQLNIVGSASMRRFLDGIGVHGARGDLVPVVRAGREYREGCLLRRVPSEVTELVRTAIKTSGLSHAEVVRQAGFDGYRVGQAPVLAGVSNGSRTCSMMAFCACSPRATSIGTASSTSNRSERARVRRHRRRDSQLRRQRNHPRKSLEQDADVVIFFTATRCTTRSRRIAGSGRHRRQAPRRADGIDAVGVPRTVRPLRQRRAARDGLM